MIKKIFQAVKQPLLTITTYLLVLFMLYLLLLLMQISLPSIFFYLKTNYPQIYIFFYLSMSCLAAGDLFARRFEKKLLKHSLIFFSILILFRLSIPFNLNRWLDEIFFDYNYPFTIACFFILLGIFTSRYSKRIFFKKILRVTVIPLWILSIPLAFYYPVHIYLEDNRIPDNTAFFGAIAVLAIFRIFYLLKTKMEPISSAAPLAETVPT